VGETRSSSGPAAKSIAESRDDTVGAIAGAVGYENGAHLPDVISVSYGVCESSVKPYSASGVTCCAAVPGFDLTSGLGSPMAGRSRRCCAEPGVNLIRFVLRVEE